VDEVMYSFQHQNKSMLKTNQWYLIGHYPITVIARNTSYFLNILYNAYFK